MSTTRQLKDWRLMVSSISLKPDAKFPLPLSFSILPPSLLHSSWLLAFTICPQGVRSYYPCRWKRKGCYSLVTLCGCSRFRALMDSLHWRKVPEMRLVLRPVRSIHLCHWHYLLESEWHLVSPESTKNLQEQTLHGPFCCPGVNTTTDVQRCYTLASLAWL